MKLIQRYCYLLLLGFVFPLATIDAVAAGAVREGEKKEIYLHPENKAANLLAQGLTRVTGVEVNQTESG